MKKRIFSLVIVSLLVFMIFGVMSVVAADCPSGSSPSTLTIERDGKGTIYQGCLNGKKFTVDPSSSALSKGEKEFGTIYFEKTAKSYNYCWTGKGSNKAGCFDVTKQIKEGEVARVSVHDDDGNEIGSLSATMFCKDGADLVNGKCPKEESTSKSDDSTSTPLPNGPPVKCETAGHSISSPDGSLSIDGCLSNGYFRSKDGRIFRLICPEDVDASHCTWNKCSGSPSEISKDPAKSCDAESPYRRHKKNKEDDKKPDKDKDSDDDDDDDKCLPQYGIQDPFATDNNCKKDSRKKHQRSEDACKSADGFDLDIHECTKMICDAEGKKCKRCGGDGGLSNCPEDCGKYGNCFYMRNSYDGADGKKKCEQDHTYQCQCLKEDKEKGCVGGWKRVRPMCYNWRYKSAHNDCQEAEIAAHIEACLENAGKDKKAQEVCKASKVNKPEFFSISQHVNKRFLFVDYDTAIKEYVEGISSKFWGAWLTGETLGQSLPELWCNVKESTSEKLDDGVALSKTGKTYMHIEGEYSHVRGVDIEKPFQYKITFDLNPSECGLVFEVVVRDGQTDIPLFTKPSGRSFEFPVGNLTESEKNQFGEPLVNDTVRWVPGNEMNGFPSWDIIPGKNPHEEVCVKVKNSPRCFEVRDLCSPLVESEEKYSSSPGSDDPNDPDSGSSGGSDDDDDEGGAVINPEL